MIMSENNMEDLVTPTMVRGIFEDYVIGDGRKGWCLMLCGRVLTVNGKMFYKSRQQAIKAFYNSYHWRAMREMHSTLNHDTNGWWRSPLRTDYWKAFKSALKEKYGFRVVEL